MSVGFYNHPTNRGLTLKNRSFTIWKEFTTQQKAFDYVDGHPSNELAIFSYEHNPNEPGLRKFLVSSSRTDFYYEYMELDQSKRHFYELIRAAVPCHLYFDLEFGIKENPETDGELLVALFKDCVAKKFKTDFDVDSLNIVDLESTTNTKFSRHLIVKVNNRMFSSNNDCGIFLQELLNERNQDFLVFNKDYQRTSFADQSVYSKNRNFRIVLSSKIGKSRPLQFVDAPYMMSLERFLNSLVCYTADSKVQLFPSKCTLLATTAEKKYYFKPSPLNWLTDASPFPEIERFLLQSIKRKSQSIPWISSFVLYQESKTIVYNILGSRYCERVQREHKSNGQFYVVDLLLQKCSQKCYDPDCRGFSGRQISIPPEICPRYIGEEDLYGGVTDEELLQLEGTTIL